MSLLLPPYSTGSASVVYGGTLITGSSVLWTDSNAQELDTFVHVASGLTAFIRSVPDSNHLAIDPWPGSDISNAAYRIDKTSPLRYAWGTALANVQNLLDTLNGQTFYTVIGDAPDDQYGEENQYALKTNGGGWKLWLKTGGIWVLQGAPAGITYRGEWNGPTPYATNDRVSEDGTSYIAKQPNTNVRPSTDTTFTYWDAGGIKGDPGTNGVSWTSGTAVPTGGADGDFYYRESNGDVYKKIAGTWTVIFNSKGATGAVPIISATSSSSVTVPTSLPASRVFVAQAGLAIVVGQRYRAINPGGDRVMVGRVTEYTGPNLTLSVDYAQGVGADSVWALAIAGEVGPQGGTGPTGATGPQGSTGPQGPAGAPSTIPGPKGDIGNGLQPDASGTFAQRATYDGQSQGYKFLQTDVSPFLLWVKASNTSADWAGPNPIGSFAAVGDLGHATDSVISSFDYGHAA